MKREFERAKKAVESLFWDTCYAAQFIRTYYQQIIQKWVDYFVMKKQINCTEIKTRL